MLGDVLFFFQAEDGIRDLYVTGVQTCALPILARRAQSVSHGGAIVSQWVKVPGSGSTASLIDSHIPRISKPRRMSPLTTEPRPWRHSRGPRTGVIEPSAPRTCHSGSS